MVFYRFDGKEWIMGSGNDAHITTKDEHAH